MRVKLTTDRVAGGAVQYQDETIDLPPGEAQRLVAAGQAEPVGPETALRQPPQRATRPQPKAKRRP